MHKRMLQLFLALALLVTIPNLTPSLQRQARLAKTSAGISQLVENRAGHSSCWGVIIHLGSSRFKKKISPEQIEIIEGKHGHDLKDTMIWSVQQAGKRLTIKFKLGMGEFGSGNRVEVRIRRSALVEPISSGNDYFEWVIDTDVL